MSLKRCIHNPCFSLPPPSLRRHTRLHSKTKQSYISHLQEPHGDIVRRTAPALQAVSVAEGNRGGGRNVEQVRRTNARGEQRLVGVPPSGVGDEQTLAVAHGFRKCRWSVLMREDETKAS